MAVIALMLDTGLRLSEVVTLNFDDFHLQDRYIKVLGKMRRAIIRLYEVQSCRAKTLAIGVRKSV